MTKKLCLLFAMAISSFASSLALANAEIAKPPQLDAGYDAVAHANLIFEDGRPFRLSDYRGKLLIINYWANWCTNCLSEMAAIKSMQDQLGGPDKAAVILLSGDLGAWEKDRVYAKTHNFHFPLIHFSSQPQGRPYASMVMGNLTPAGQVAFGLPVSLVVAPSGAPLMMVKGTLNWAAPAMVQAFADAIDHKPAIK